jgi:hypothetical protein
MVADDAALTRSRFRVMGIAEIAIGKRINKATKVPFVLEILFFDMILLLVFGLNSFIRS